MKGISLTLLVGAVVSATLASVEAGGENFITRNEEPWAPLFWTAIAVVSLLLVLFAIRAFNAKYALTAADRAIVAPKFLQTKGAPTAPPEQYTPARVLAPHARLIDENPPPARLRSTC